MGGTGTGTPSVAGTGTVQSIYDAIQYRRDINTNADDIIHIVNMAIRTIAKRLYALGSDLITGQLAVAIDYDVEDEYGVLPVDYWGLNGDPYISTRTITLAPLPSQAAALQYQSAGEPQYYQVRGLKMYLWPFAGEDITIKGAYFVKPTLVTAVTSAVPFNELFDDLIAEYIAMYFRGPGEGGNILGILDKLVRDGVDMVALKYDRKGPTGCAQVINWNRW
jgi:hypothetical protein